MKSFEDALINQVYADTKLDRVHCLFTVRRNSFVESAVSKAAIDSIAIRILLTTPPHGLYPIVVYLYQHDGSEIHGQVTLYAQRFDSVLTVGTSAKRGQLGQKANTHLEFREITKIIETPVRTEAALANTQFRRHVRAGSILTAEMLERIPDIEPGDEVLITYQHGALLLNARGKALGRGIVGESVRVRNLSSNKILTATITGSGIVALQAPGAGSR